MHLISSVQNGLAFQCKRCGKCCSAQMEGYIYVFKEDIEKLAQFLEYSIVKFAQKCLKIVYYKFHVWDEQLEDTGEREFLPTLVLNTEKLQDCMFLGENNGQKLCKAYPIRPFQCQSYPCWMMILTEKEEDYESAQNACLGFRIDHNQADHLPIELITRDQILEWLKREREIEKNYYDIMKKNNFDIFKVYPFLKKTSLVLPSKDFQNLPVSEIHEL